MRIVGYKRNIELKYEELDFLLNELIPDRLGKIYKSSFLEKNKDKEYTNTRLSKDENFKHAYEWVQDMAYYDKFVTILPAMMFQRAGFPLPKPKLLYQNVERDAAGWFEVQSAIVRKILDSQICYARVDSRQQLHTYNRIGGYNSVGFNSTHLVVLHELCHYLHYAIEDIDSIEVKDKQRMGDLLETARLVSEYAKTEYVEFQAEALQMLFRWQEFTPDFKNNSLGRIINALAQPTMDSNLQFVKPYNKLLAEGYTSQYETDKKLINQFNLTEDNIKQLAEKSDDFYPLSNRIDTIMYCKANYYSNTKIRFIFDKLICYINDVYDLLPSFKNIQKLEIYLNK